MFYYSCGSVLEANLDCFVSNLVCWHTDKMIKLSQSKYLTVNCVIKHNPRAV